jgi:hypothetical protein
VAWTLVARHGSTWHAAWCTCSHTCSHSSSHPRPHPRSHTRSHTSSNSRTHTSTSSRSHTVVSDWLVEGGHIRLSHDLFYPFQCSYECVLVTWYNPTKLAISPNKQHCFDGAKDVSLMLKSQYTKIPRLHACNSFESCNILHWFIELEVNCACRVGTEVETVLQLVQHTLWIIR